jgi:hypothetical protein
MERNNNNNNNIVLEQAFTAYRSYEQRSKFHDCCAEQFVLYNCLKFPGANGKGFPRISMLVEINVYCKGRTVVALSLLLL